MLDQVSKRKDFIKLFHDIAVIRKYMHAFYRYKQYIVNRESDPFDQYKTSQA